MSEFRIGIAGLGVVGAETARQLITSQERLSKRAGKSGDEVMLIGNKGTLIRTQVDQISVIGRNTQGVKVVSTRADEKLVDAVGFKESLDEE